MQRLNPESSKGAGSECLEACAIILANVLDLKSRILDSIRVQELNRTEDFSLLQRWTISQLQMIHPRRISFAEIPSAGYVHNFSDFLDLLFRKSDI